MDWLTDAIDAEASSAPPPPAAIPVQQGRVVHIDADYLAYWAAGGDELPVGIARRVCAERIEAFREMSGSDTAMVHLTARGSTKGHRALAATVKPYQGHRTGQKPKNWADMREYLEHAEHVQRHRTIWYDCEADDGAAYYSAASTDPGALVAIATRDKDFRMIPGRHINWENYTEVIVPRGTYELIGDLDGLVYGTKWFWLQMLQGDTADNIPGLPLYFGKKIGAVGASKALDGTTCNAEAYEVVAKGYHAHYGDGWSDRMAEQACLLWLRTDAGASIDNFLSVCPLHKAARRLLTRIATQRSELEQIDNIHAGAVPQETCGGTS